MCTYGVQERGQSKRQILRNSQGRRQVFKTRTLEGSASSETETEVRKLNLRILMLAGHLEIRKISEVSKKEQ